MLFDSKYQILRFLGKGGIGKVYSVKLPEKNSILALKIIRKLPVQESIEKLFRNEFKIASCLNHSCIVRVFDFGKIREGILYFTMEYVEGETLKTNLIKKFGFDLKLAPLTEIIAYALQILDSIIYLHSNGLVHFDIKPSNIFVSCNETINGFPLLKLGDFGLSRCISASFRMKYFAGTPHYSAPEFFLSQPVDERSDLYSFGILLYEMLTGQLPFKCRNLSEMIHEKIHCSPENLNELRPDINQEINNLLISLLNPSPSGRPCSAKIVRNILASTFKTTVFFPQVTGKIFVAREDVIDKIESILKELKNGKGNGILISGERGAGKSLVCEKIKNITQLNDCGWINIECSSDFHPQYSPLEQLTTAALQRINRFKGSSNNSCTTLISELHAIQHQTNHGNTVFFQELIKILNALTPLVLCVEDLHDADFLTSNFLTYISEYLSEMPILIIGTIDLDEAEWLELKKSFSLKPFTSIKHILFGLVMSGIFQRIHLNLFGLEEIKIMLIKYGVTISSLDRLTKKLYTESRGNPKLLHFMLRLLFLEPDDDNGINLAADPDFLITQRIKNLSKTSFELLVFIAFFNGGLEISYIRNFINELPVYTPDQEDPLLHLLRENLLTRVIIKEKEIVSLYFPNMKKEILKQYSRSERISYHCTIAASLENYYRDKNQKATAELAYHYSKSRNDYKALIYSIKAGRDALRRQDLVQAFHFLRISFYWARKTNRLRLFNLLTEKIGDIAIMVAFTSHARYFYLLLIKDYESQQKENNRDILRLFRKTGELYLKLGKVQTALDYFLKGLSFLDKKSNFKENFLLLLGCGRSFELLSRFDNAFYNTKKALDLAVKTNSNSMIAKSSNQTAAILISAGKYDESLNYLRMSLKPALKAHDKGTLAAIYNNFGVLHWKMGSFNLAVKVYRNCLRLRKEIHDLYNIANTFDNLGAVCYKLNEYEAALDHFRKSLHYRIRLNDLKGISSSLNNLGILSFEIGAFEEALKNYNKCLEINDFIDDKEGLSKIYNNLGLIFARKREFKPSLIHFTKSLKLKKTLKDFEGQIITENNIATILHSMTRWKNSLNHFIKIGKKLASNDLPSKIKLTANVLDGLALNYFSLGELEKANQNIIKSLNIRKKLKETGRLAESYLILGNVLLYRGYPVRSRINFYRSISLISKLKRPHLLFEAYKCIIESFLFEKKAIKASEKFDRMITLIEKTHEDHVQGQILSLKARIMSNFEEPGTALEYFKKCIEIFSNSGDKFELGKNYYYLGQALHEWGFRNPSLMYLENAKEIFMKVDAKYELKNVEEMINSFSIISRPFLDGVKILSKISELLNSLINLDDLLNKTLDLLLEGVHAERGMITLLNQKTNVLEIKVARNLERETIKDASEFSKKIIEHVYTSEEILHSANAQDDSYFNKYESIIKYRILSFICLPLRQRGTVIGTIYVDNRSFLLPFGQQELEFIKTFSNLAAVAIENSMARNELKIENMNLKSMVIGEYGFENIIGCSDKMKQICRIMRNVLNNDSTVLIQGETGTGKELVAKAIHYNGHRKDGPFIPIDCGVLHENLIESELFGHAKGAFSGAFNEKKGLFEVAHGGTIFLDEIGNINLNVQAKLLRVLQEGEFRRIGETITRKVNVRIICASNRDLNLEVENNRFRKDLYYRIKIVTIDLPSLKNRKEDIPILVRYFIDKLSKKLKTRTPTLSKDVIRKFMDYEWPGNIREMENAIENFLVLYPDSEITEEIVIKVFEGKKTSQKQDLKDTRLSTLEKTLIIDTLSQNKWNQTRAAKALGLSERVLRYKMTKMGIVNPRKTKDIKHFSTNT